MAPLKNLTLVLASLLSAASTEAFTVGGSGYAPVFTGSATDASKKTCILSDPRAGETGVPDWMDCSAGDVSDACSFSTTFWIKSYGGSGSTTETTPITYAVAGTSDFFLNMFIPGSVIMSEQGYTTYDQPGISLDFGAWDLYSSDWEHLAITWDATADGGFKFYLNGELMTAQPTGALMSPVGPGGILILGQEPDGYGDENGGFSTDAGQAFAGSLDEMRFFKKVLTAAEIAADMETPYTQAYGAANDIVLALTFDDPYYTDADGYTRVPVQGIGGFPDLFVGNPDDGFSEDSKPILGPSGVTYPMGGDVVTLVEPEVGATQDVTLMASSTATTFTIESVPACCSVTDSNDVALSIGSTTSDPTVKLTVITGAAVDGDSFSYSAGDGTDTGSAAVKIIAAVSPTQIQAACADDILQGEYDPDKMFTLYGHSTAGAATNIEFVTVPEHGTLYQAKSDGKNSLSPDMDSPIAAGHITSLVGGRFYYVVDQVEAYTGLEDDWDTFTYYVIDEFTGMRSSEIGTRVFDIDFKEHLPVTDDIAKTLVEDSSIILDLGQAVDPEGSDTLPVVTTLPSHGKLYQVTETGEKGDEIVAGFNPWEVREPMKQWVHSVGQSVTKEYHGYSLSYGSSYGNAISSWGVQDLIGPPENCANSEEGTLCASSCASTTYCPSLKNGIQASALLDVAPTNSPTMTPSPTMKSKWHVEYRSAVPTPEPTSSPVPSSGPTSAPTLSPVPSSAPTSVPTMISPVPSSGPTSAPTPDPSMSVVPSSSPTVTAVPTPTVTAVPTPYPNCIDKYGSDGAVGADGWCDEYIDLAYETPVRPTKVEVFDGYGGGTTVGVEILNPSTGEFDKLWNGDEFFKDDVTKKVTNGEIPKTYIACEANTCNKDPTTVCMTEDVPIFPKDLNPSYVDSDMAILVPVLCERSYLTQVIRIRLNSHDVDSWNCIDAVRLTGEADLKTGFISNSKGYVMYVPDSDYAGDDSFKYSSTDCLSQERDNGGIVAESDYATVSLTVANSADAPLTDPKTAIFDYAGYDLVEMMNVSISAQDLDLDLGLDSLTTTITSIQGGISLFQIDGTTPIKVNDVLTADALAGAVYVLPECKTGHVDVKIITFGYTITDTTGASVSGVQEIQVTCGCTLMDGKKSICFGDAEVSDKYGVCYESCGYDNDEGKCPDGFDGGACQIDLGLRNGLKIVGVVVLVCELVLVGLMIYWRQTPVFKAASPLLSTISGVGVIISTASIFFMTEYNSDIACILSPLFIDFGFVAIAVPMFARVYRISKVFNSKKLRTIAVREADMIRLCTPFWVLWLLYHLVWIVVDKPKLQEMTASDKHSSYTWYECKSSEFTWDVPVFWACALLLAYGAMVCWEIRKVPSKFNESKFIAFVIYTTTLLGLLGVAILLILPKEDQNNRVVLQVVGAVVLPFCYCCGLIVPKFMEVLRPNSVITPGNNVSTGTMNTTDSSQQLRTTDSRVDQSSYVGSEEALAAKDEIIAQMREQLAAMKNSSAEK